MILLRDIPVAIARSCWVFMFMALLTGCNVTADEKAPQPTSTLPNELAALAWVASANAEKDAQEAIAQQDYRLYVVATRGESTPGVDTRTAKQLKAHCGKRTIPGSTDVIKSDEHLAALKHAYDYAAQYNQIVAQYCSVE